MLADHNRMAAYHAAIAGNPDVFKDKVVMDVGTGSGILAVWAAQAGARRVYAIEYTDMANHARRVVQSNGVDHIVTVIQGAVEEVVLPEEDWDDGCLTLGEGQNRIHEDGTKNQQVVDVILSGKTLKRDSVRVSLTNDLHQLHRPPFQILNGQQIKSLTRF